MESFAGWAPVSPTIQIWNYMDRRTSYIGSIHEFEEVESMISRWMILVKEFERVNIHIPCIETTTRASHVAFVSCVAVMVWVEGGKVVVLPTHSPCMHETLGSALDRLRAGWVACMKPRLSRDGQTGAAKSCLCI